MRYFFVYYTFKSKYFSGEGNMTFMTKSGFPSMSKIKDYCKGAIIKKHPEASDGLDIIIANIQKLKKSDYESFIL